MSERQAKFCTDRDKVRWILLEGMITRRTAQEDPTAGMNLPVGEVRSVDKTSVKRVRHSSLGWPVTIIGIIFLALTAWLAMVSWIAAIPLGLLGLLILVWGAKRIPAQTDVFDAYQIVAPGTNPAEWLVVGSHLEVEGFVNGVRNEVEGRKREKVATRN